MGALYQLKKLKIQPPEVFKQKNIIGVLFFISDLFAFKDEIF